MFKTFHVLKHLCDFEGVPREKLGQHCRSAEFVVYVPCTYAKHSPESNDEPPTCTGSARTEAVYASTLMLF